MSGHNTASKRAPAVPELDTHKSAPTRAEIITAEHPDEILYIILAGTVKIYGTSRSMRTM